MGTAFDHLLDRYARLVIRVGVNVQLGQSVVIRACPEQLAVARALTKEAYRVGASNVTTDFTDSYALRAKVELAQVEFLGSVAPWEVEGVKAWREHRPAVIVLVGNPHPGLMDGLDPDRMARLDTTTIEAEILPLLATNQVAWCVVGAPTPEWAESLFGTPDLVRLWDAVATAMRLDCDDPVQAWLDHLAKLRERADMLNARAFDQVRFQGPGTDLTVGLTPGATQWLTAEMTSANGTDFVANMPTEEVFTSPDWRRADGHARVVSPFMLPGLNQRVEDLALELYDGRIASVTAAEGEDAVRHQLESVPRARHLGEIAIVDGSSRVRRTGITYGEMLYDENIGSHVAWGNGFTAAVKGAVDLSPEGRVDSGLNQSPVHVDVVLGNSEVRIDGIAADGIMVPLVEGNDFVLPTA